MSRAMWSGTISFGLVNIPVKMYASVREHDIHFHMLSKDGQCRLRRKLVCPDTGEEFEFKDTTRGFEIGPDEYVIVNDKELEALKPEAGRSIDISDFVDLSEIDPIYYDRPYYLVPDEKGKHAYDLLFEALSRSQKVGIAKFVLREKEYLAAIRPMRDLICLETMRYHDEVVPAKDVGERPARGKINSRELASAEQLIDALVSKFDPTKYRDEYRDRVEELVQQKAEGKEIKPHADKAPEPTRMINLMDALQKSIAAARERADARPTAPRGGRSAHHKGVHRRSTRKKTA